MANKNRRWWTATKDTVSHIKLNHSFCWKKIRCREDKQASVLFEPITHKCTSENHFLELLRWQVSDLPEGVVREMREGGVCARSLVATPRGSQLSPARATSGIPFLGTSLRNMCATRRCGQVGCHFRFNPRPDGAPVIFALSRGVGAKCTWKGRVSFSYASQYSILKLPSNGLLILISSQLLLQKIYRIIIRCIINLIIAMWSSLSYGLEYIWPLKSTASIVPDN